MTRDMELIRKILIVIEKKYVDSWIPSSDIKIEGYDSVMISYHCALLYDAGLVYDYKQLYSGVFGVSHLTWAGHDFLEKIRSDTVWNRTKTIITEKGLPIAIDVIKEIASAVTTSMVKSALQLV